MTLTIPKSLFPPCLWPLSTVGLTLPTPQMGQSGPREGRALLSAPLCSKLGAGRAADTVPRLQPCQGQRPALKSTVRPPPRLQGAVGAVRRGLPQRWQPGHTPFRAPASCRSRPPATLSCTSLSLNKHTPSSQSLSFLASGRGQNGCGATGSGLGRWRPPRRALMSPLWDQAPMVLLRSEGTGSRPPGGSPHNDLPPKFGRWPQEEGQPWGQRQGPGDLVEGGPWLL